MENWDYALLSQQAKEAGGPEVFVNNLVKLGRQIGVRETWTKVGIVAGVATGAALVVLTIVNMVQQKKKRAEIKKLKAELIQGIKEYDRQQANRISAENDTRKDSEMIDDKAGKED